MPERDALPEDFVGKTIAAVDTDIANVWRFEFTDGTKIAIEADLHYGIPIMQVCPECAEQLPESDDWRDTSP